MQQQGDTMEKKFLEAFDKLSDSLFRHCFFRVSNREVAKDMVQDTFMKTWREIYKGQQIENMQSFLYRVANNLIIDYYRKAKSDSLDNLLDNGYDPKGDDAAGIMAVSELSLTMEAMNTLSEKDRRVLVMRHVDGFSPKEIAEEIGETENTVSVRIHRAIQRLKEKTKHE
jgi:RNA polymerase sigma-70 factor, ECF subfamily